MNKTICTSILLATALTASPHLWGETVSIVPSKDNTIYEEGDFSNGQGANLFAGRTAANRDALRRALLQFSVSPTIPSGVTIESVSLELSMNRTITGSQAMTLHKVTQDWGEGASDASGQEGGGTQALTGDATWAHTFFSGQSWNSPGGDFVSTASATTNVGGNGKYTWSGAAMVADVQSWVDDPSSNFGWILIGLESTNSAKRFASRHSTLSGDRPLLTITYSEAAATWAGYPIEADGRSVFTDGFLGWIDIGGGAYVYVYALNKYIYAPEENVSATGGWVWIGQ